MHDIGETGAAADLGSRETISSQRTLAAPDSGRQPLLGLDGSGNRYLLDIEVPTPGADSRKGALRSTHALWDRVSPRMGRGPTCRPATSDRWRSLWRVVIR